MPLPNLEFPVLVCTFYGSKAAALNVIRLFEAKGYEKQCRFNTVRSDASLTELALSAAELHLQWHCQPNSACGALKLYKYIHLKVLNVDVSPSFDQPLHLTELAVPGSMVQSCATLDGMSNHACFLYLQAQH